MVVNSINMAVDIAGKIATKNKFLAIKPVRKVLVSTAELVLVANLVTR